MYDEFFAKAHQLIEQGVPFATAVVVRSEKPTSGKPGDKAIVTLDGVMFGWIGGSCAQPTVIAEAQSAIAEDAARLVRITPDPGREAPPEGVKEVEMTCFSGGTLDVYIEPQQPRPRLLVIGHLPTAQSLAHLGKAMSYQVIAVDTETDGVAMAHADEVLTNLEAIADHVNPLTYVVVATHGHYDELALEHALRTPAPYVGLVASRKRSAPIIDYLRQHGFGDSDLARLVVPAGLDIQARRGDEIALSIMAEIIQHRRNAERLEWPVEANDEIVEEAAESSCCGGGASDDTSVDPICGMTVKTTSAAHIHEHDGTVYFFCCAGCQTKFAANPEEYSNSASN